MTFSPRTLESSWRMEEGKGQGGLATSRQYGNALLGVRYQEEEEEEERCTLCLNFVFRKVISH